MTSMALWRQLEAGYTYVVFSLAGKGSQPFAGAQARADNAPVGYRSGPFQRGSRPSETRAEGDHHDLAAGFYPTLVNRLA